MRRPLRLSFFCGRTQISRKRSPEAGVLRHEPAAQNDCAREEDAGCGAAEVAASPSGGSIQGSGCGNYGGFTATRLMMRCTKTTCVWMWLAIDGTNSVMKLSMGAVAKPTP